jgi:hypothetical protein
MEISQGNYLCSYLYLKQGKTSCFSFYLLFSSTKPENRRAEQVLSVGQGSPVVEGFIQCKKCVHKYVIRGGE